MMGTPEGAARIRVLVVFGTRPEAIKMAPVVLALQGDPRFAVDVAVTAQHREMLDQVLELFGIEPGHDLDIMEHGQSLTQVTCRALTGIGGILESDPVDVVMVHGDTTTTFAASLAAFYHRIPVAHVEAGMRTHDLAHPFPEEANRALVGRVASWNFAPSQSCVDNLLAEGVAPELVIRTPHNTAIDALRLVERTPYDFPDGAIASALSSGRRIILATTHRRESWGEPMEGIFNGIRRVAEAHDDVHVLVATHPNPIVADAAQRILGAEERVTLIGAQDYLPFVKLMSAADLIVSDSGGIQEEGPALGTPVLVLRDVTEYPELIERGVIALAGTDEESVASSMERLLSDDSAYEAMKLACAASREADSTTVILEALADAF